MEIKVTKNNFEQEVLKSDIPVLVDFWAVWCGPCQMLAPVLEDIASEYEGKIKVAKINVDEETELAIKYGVQAIPTMLLFKNGQIVNKSVGYLDKAEVKEMLK